MVQASGEEVGVGSVQNRFGQKQSDGTPSFGGGGGGGMMKGQSSFGNKGGGGGFGGLVCLLFVICTVFVFGVLFSITRDTIADSFNCRYCASNLMALNVKLLYS